MIKIDANKDVMDEKEITAYIQQQMVELAPHLEEKASLQMRLSQIQSGFEAELTATLDEGEIQTVGRNEDVYNAIRDAKEGLLQYVVEVEAEINPQSRDEKISQLTRNGNLYLH